MIRWFWIWFFYSLGGYGLEKWYAARTGARNKNRKGFLLLPLCPVYGLGMLAVLALPEARRTLLLLPAWGAFASTAAEYAVHWAYERWLGVHFWDYRGVRWNVRGRICLPFSLAWGALSAAAVVLVQPVLEGWILRIPPAVSLGMLLGATADAVLSVRVLRQTKDPEQLHPAALAGPVFRPGQADGHSARRTGLR